MGLGKKIKRAVRAAVVEPAKTVEKKVTGVSDDILKGKFSSALDLALETGGFSTTGIGSNLGGRSALELGKGVLDIAGIGGKAESVEETPLPSPGPSDDPDLRRKQLLDQQRRNAPGIRQQSVFTPRG